LLIDLISVSCIIYYFIFSLVQNYDSMIRLISGKNMTENENIEKLSATTDYFGNNLKILLYTFLLNLQFKNKYIV
jgi:hypothetical protein